MKNGLARIFLKQRLLMQTYLSIEAKLMAAHGTQLTIPVDLDDRDCQMKLRNVAWWIVEEANEALVEYEETGRSEAFKEELVDCLHFMVELCILSGIYPEELKQDAYPAFSLEVLDKSFHTRYADFNTGTFIDLTKFLAKGINQLKNKPWKQTEKKTNREEYLSCIRASLHTLIKLMVQSGMTADDIYNGYVGKNKTNQKRQEGGY